MQPDALVVTLKSLKLHGMAQALGELAAARLTAVSERQPVLTALIKAEVAEREVRSVAYQMKAPGSRSIGTSPASTSRRAPVDEALVRQLHGGDFMDQAQNIVLVGGPGTGKTHLATAIGVHAIEHVRRRVRFFSTIELVNALEHEKAIGKSGTAGLAPDARRPGHPR